ncbi:PTS sugar transporter subunit IIB [Allosalinactinospora lopnorensis]|uniref:PTS lactose transporter subunit IIB n=1 Tax=Allosalinactinospora lopnorensis TaxID=1352348 RepID=UPI000623FC30|nr:PTS lactose transporter subunit IIB [Allosalinactinospora lopnorensis]
MSTINGSDIKKVIVACDAGMGSSVLLTSQLTQSLGAYDVTVEHAPVDHIPADTDVVLCHSALLDRARTTVSDTVVLGFNMFFGDPAFIRLEQAIKAGEPLAD